MIRFPIEYTEEDFNYSKSLRFKNSLGFHNCEYIDPEQFPGIKSSEYSKDYFINAYSLYDVYSIYNPENPPSQFPNASNIDSYPMGTWSPLYASIGYTNHQPEQPGVRVTYREVPGRPSYRGDLWVEEEFLQYEDSKVGIYNNKKELQFTYNDTDIWKEKSDDSDDHSFKNKNPFYNDNWGKAIIDSQKRRCIRGGCCPPKDEDYTRASAKPIVEWPWCFQPKKGKKGRAPPIPQSMGIQNPNKDFVLGGGGVRSVGGIGGGSAISIPTCTGTQLSNPTNVQSLPISGIGSQNKCSAELFCPPQYFNEDLYYRKVLTNSTKINLNEIKPLVFEFEYPTEIVIDYFYSPFQDLQKGFNIFTDEYSPYNSNWYFYVETWNRDTMEYKMYKAYNYYDSSMVRNVSNGSIEPYSLSGGNESKTKLFFGLSYTYKDLIFEWNMGSEQLWINGIQSDIDIHTCRKIETFYKKIYILDDSNTLHTYNYTDSGTELISLGELYDVKDMVFDKLGGKLIYVTDSELFINEDGENEVKFSLSTAHFIKELRLTEFGNTLIALTENGSIYQLGLDNYAISEQPIYLGSPSELDENRYISMRKLGPYGKFGVYDTYLEDYVTLSTYQLITANIALMPGIEMWDLVLDGKDIQFIFAKNSLPYTSTISNQSCIFDDENFSLNVPSKYILASEELTKDVNENIDTSETVKAHLNTSNIFLIDGIEKIIFSLAVLSSLVIESKAKLMSSKSIDDSEYLRGNVGEIVLRQGNIKNNMYGYFPKDFLYEYFNLFYGNITYSPTYESGYLFGTEINLTQLIRNELGNYPETFPFSIYMLGKDNEEYLHIEIECTIQEDNIIVNPIAGDISEGIGYWEFGTSGIWEYIRGYRYPEVTGTNSYYCVPLEQNSIINYQPLEYSCI